MNNLIPTKEQALALDLMADFLAGESEDAFCLKGFAGTGKTATIKLLREIFPHLRFVFTAPTNKAVQVLEKFGASPAETIHRLLGLALKQVKGKEVLVRVKDPKIEDFDVVVIDECSMINAELFSMIEDFFPSTHIIFMGDPMQLPPVGEKISKSFELTNQFVLEKIMRQSPESHLLNLLSQIRDSINYKLPVRVKPSPDIEIFSHRDWAHQFPRAFSHENFDSDPDSARVIAWRNKTVDSINSWIQGFRYPDLQEPFAIGEPIVFSKPLLGSMLTDDLIEPEIVVCSTETEATILECSGEQTEKSISFPFHRILVRTIFGNEFEFFTLAQSGFFDFQRELKQCADHKLWAEYFKLKNSFATIRSCYAMTAHKSQGSTFNRVFVHVPDILSSRNKVEAAKCLYVACSRASTKLTLNTNLLFNPRGYKQ